MAGHSQFKNIMYRKGAQDAKRAKVFNKIIREITVSARSGLPDPNANPRLRSALAAARTANMPKDNIERALKKALGAGDTTMYEEVLYEGYGPGGVAIIVEGLTDNRNRAAAEVRSIFNKHGGNLGEAGSVSFLFDHLGCFQLPKEIAPFDTIFDTAVEAGANNIEEIDDIIEITTDLENFARVRDHLIHHFGDHLEAKLIWKPLTLAACDADTAHSLIKLIDALEDNDDVQNVFANFDIPKDILDQIST